MYPKAIIILAIIGVTLSLIMCFFSLVTWEMAGVLITVFLGIPVLLSQVKAKPKEKEHKQEVKAEEKEILHEETIRVSPKQDVYYDSQLVRGDNLKGKISSSSHIDILIVNQTNFKKWEKDKTFYYEYYTESVFETTIDYVVPRKGMWYVLIENNGRKTAKVKVLLYL